MRLKPIFRVLTELRHKNPQSSGFKTRSDTKPQVQSQKKSRSLKFRIEMEELYFLCSENKGADQLCST